MILRVTTFSWGDSCHNWYPDMEAVQRQLKTEVGRTKSKDIIGEQWYEAKPIDTPAIDVPIASRLATGSGLNDSIPHPGWRP